MKLNLIGAMMAAVMTIIATPRAFAGPDPSNTRWYTPVRTMAEAEAIKPGTRIAMRCGKCGAVFNMIADKDQSYLHDWTCPACKQKFVVRKDAHGEYILEDDSGHRSDLLHAND